MEYMGVKIDLEKDKLFDELGIKRLQESYMRDDETSPQQRFAYVSSSFGSNTEHAQRLYDYASNHWLSYSTPILSYGRSKRGMPISCFLNYIEDTAEGLVDNRALFKNVNLEEIKFDKKFDLIVSNPPYLPDVSLKNLNSDIKLYEPKIALQGGVQGVDFLYKIIDLASKILKINGLLALEIGDNQFHILAKYLKENRFKILDKYTLINKQVRCLLATKL